MDADIKIIDDEKGIVIHDIGDSDGDEDAGMDSDGDSVLATENCVFVPREMSVGGSLVGPLGAAGGLAPSTFWSDIPINSNIL